MFIQMHMFIGTAQDMNNEKMIADVLQTTITYCV